MTNRKIKELMRDIDTKYQQKADARAAAVVHSPHRSRIPSLMVCGAAACCAVVAAAVILPKLKTQQLDIAASEAQSDAPEQFEVEYVTEPVEEFHITGISDGVIRLMSPAYAPYILEISKEQQEDLSSDIVAAAMVAKIQAEENGSVWQPCDPDMPYPDGEYYSVFVYNDGDPYRLTAYSDNTIVKEQDGAEVRWQFPDGIYDAFAAAANPAQPGPNESFARNPLDGHLTWCAVDTINAKDIWKNTNVGAKECDMTSKDDVFYKMSNTADYYNRLSCIYITGAKPKDSPYFIADRCVFRADLNAGKAVEKKDYYYSTDADALMRGCDGCTKDDSGSFTYATDGEKYYSATEYDHNCYIMGGVTHRIDSPAIENDARVPEQEDIKDDGFFHYDYDFYHSRVQLLDGMGLDILENSKLVLGYLFEFDLWDIVGTEQINGRTCVHIRGSVNSKCVECDYVKDFDMYTDAETGMIVKLLGYDENGALSRFIITQDLAFEDDAEPVIQPDFSDYEVKAIPEPVYSYRPGNADLAGEPVTDMPEQEAPAAAE